MFHEPFNVSESRLYKGLSSFSRNHCFLELVTMLFLMVFLCLNKNSESRPEAPALSPSPLPPSQFPTLPLTAVSGYEYDQPALNQLNEYGPPKAQPIIEKHVYVHVPPQDNIPSRPPRPIPVRVPKKHYKVVFIKAPTPAPLFVPEIPLQPQDEEQTLIYVLVKNNEKLPDIKVPVPSPTKPTKPEVYFIKYDSKKKDKPLGPYPDRVPDKQNPPQLSDSYGVPKN